MNDKPDPMAENELQINTRIDIAQSELETPEGIVRTLTITAFHAGNWQKPIRPEDTQLWVDAINAYTTNKIIEELEHLLRISHQSNRVPIIEGWAENRIAELKALNHRKDD